MMNSLYGQVENAKYQPSIQGGLLLYGGYLAIFFTTWALNGVEYSRIGADAETARLWFALPTLFGSAFLVIALSILGWWHPVLWEKSTASPAWLWLLPVIIAGIILYNFLQLPADKLTLPLVLWTSLGAIGVGFGEEMITRGSLIAGLRSRFSETRVWLISSALFSALHIPNVIFGLTLWQMPIQVTLTFIFGSGLYAVRRTSGTLLLPMVLHGLWDCALLLSQATEAPVSAWQYSIYPLGIICVIALLCSKQTPASKA